MALNIELGCKFATSEYVCVGDRGLTFSTYIKGRDVHYFIHVVGVVGGQIKVPR